MNKYAIGEILNIAIMTKKAHVVVEGADDVKIYENLSDENCEIYPIELIEGYSGGCTHIKNAFKALNEATNFHKIEDYLIGIIDKDSSTFRETTQYISGVFTLKYYSIESHFINQESINNLIKDATNVSNKQELPNFNLEECIADIDALYYFSLESLMGSINKDYTSIVGYSDNPGRRRDINTMQKIMQKSIILDGLSQARNLYKTVESMKFFVKGKWLLTAFTEGIEKKIKELPKKCKTMQITQCKPCSFSNNTSCLFKIKDGISHNTLLSLTRNHTSNNELKYIKDRLAHLSFTAKN